MIIRWWWWLWCQKEDNGLVSRNSSNILYYYCYHDSTKCRLFFPFLPFFFVVGNIFFAFTSSFHTVILCSSGVQPSWPLRKPKTKDQQPDTHKYVHRSVNWGDEKKSTRKKVTGYYYCTLCLWVCVFVWAFSKQSSWLLKCEGVSKVEGNAKCYALHVSVIL